MRAWILDESPGEYRLGEVETPEPGPDDVRVRVVASALNHMDLWLTRGLPKPPLPHVPGADGAGVVDAIGERVDGVSAGDDVAINPAISCRRCPVCLAGESPLCPRFGIMGEHRWGAHAEYVVVPAANVVPRKPHRPWEEWAAYGLAYLTAWRMLKRARLRAGESVLVVGIGGGVSSAALVLAQAMGARVVATSRRAYTRDLALAAGAEAALDTDADFLDVQVDVVVENVGGAAFTRALKALRPGGRLVTCGGTAGPTVELSLPRLFFKQHEIIGSTMGSYAEFAEVTALFERGLPVAYEQFDGLESFPAALERLQAGDHFGKIVLRH